VVWGRPDASEPAPAEAETPPADDGNGEKKKEKKAKPDDAEAAAWLEYSDRDRDGAGFVEWTPFDHPTLGPVEIGGFVPGFRMNPPAEALDDLAERQTRFAADLIERRPTLVFEGPDVTRLADGLYEIRFGIVNDGAFPTATAMARKSRAVAPTVVRLSTSLEDVVAGNRVDRVWGIDGHGRRSVHHWIIRADAGAATQIEIMAGRLGPRRTIDVVLP
jgi:hypothetical protein